MKDQRIKEIAENLIDMFSNQDFPPAAARTVINRIAGDKEKPSANWSIINQLIMILSGTDDARGFRQWQSAGRKIKKGARAIYILAPMISKAKRERLDQSTGVMIEEDISILRGFKYIPVFRYEDTEGQPLIQYDYTPPVLPPLVEVAEYLGCTVNYKAFDHSALGSFNTRGEISLYSHDIDVFFHELAHLAHHKIKGLKAGQDAEQEVVAEFTACILCELYGFQGYHHQGWKYIKSYSDGDPVKTIQNIAALVNEVELIVRFILKVEEFQAIA